MSDTSNGNIASTALSSTPVGWARAGLKAATGLFQLGSQSNLKKKQLQSLEAQKANEGAWYNRNYNMTETAAQRYQWNKNLQALQKRNADLAGRDAVTGGTSAAVSKRAAQTDQSNLAAQAAADNSAAQRNIDAQHLANQQQLEKQRMEILRQNAQGQAQALSQIGSALG